MHDISFEPQRPSKLVAVEILELAPPGGEIFMLESLVVRYSCMNSGFGNRMMLEKVFVCGQHRIRCPSG